MSSEQIKTSVVQKLLMLFESEVYGTERWDVVEQILRILPSHEYRVEISKDKKYYHVKPNMNAEILSALIEGNKEEVIKLCDKYQHRLDEARHTAITVNDVMSNLRK